MAAARTTLLRILCGLSRNYEGEILWQGEPVQDVREQFCREMLYFGHQAGVKAVLTPEENLRWYAALQPNIAVADIQAALERVGLRGYEDVPCHSLSAGQNRRAQSGQIVSQPCTTLDSGRTLYCDRQARGGSQGKTVA